MTLLRYVVQESKSSRLPDCSVGNDRSEFDCTHATEANSENCGQVIAEYETVLGTGNGIQSIDIDITKSHTQTENYRLHQREEVREGNAGDRRYQ